MKNRKFMGIKAFVISALLLGSVPAGAFTADGFASENRDLFQTDIVTVQSLESTDRDSTASIGTDDGDPADAETGTEEADTLTAIEDITDDNSPDGDHLHTVEPMTDRAATCTEDGYTGRTRCAVCESVVDWGTVIPATGHSYTMVDEAMQCTACGDVLNDYTGIIYDSVAGVYRYFVAGKPMTGWSMVGDEYYYFGEEYDAVTGLRLINNYLYTFDENGVLTEGCFDVSGKGLIRYYWAGEIFNKGWLDVGGKTYYICVDGYAYTGKSKIEIKIGAETENEDATYVYEFYLFDDNGALIDVSGLYDYKGETLYLENGQLVYKGLVEIDGAYYYINSQYHPVTGSHYVYRTNGLVPEGYYEFDEDGKMIIIETEPKNGIVVEDGVMYYYVDDVRTYAGLIEIDGDYYYVNSQCIVVTGEYEVYKTNDLLPQGTYIFGEDGRLIGEAVSD